MAILEERGLFWWNDERIPKGAYAPEAAVGGLLKIEDNGRVRLELDGRMPTKKHPLAAYFDEIGRPTARNIQGILRGAKGFALLTRVSKSGGQLSSSGISFEIYVAMNCLVGPKAFRVDGKAPQKFRTFNVDLMGYEDWLWMGAIRVTRRKTSLAAKYKKEENLVYKTPHGILEIEYHMEGPFWGQSRQHKLSLTEKACLQFTPNAKFTLEECQTYYQLIEELLILLTDSDYNLDWPQLTTADGKRSYVLYFWRNKSAALAPGAHECLTNFSQLRADLGDLFSAWMEKRELFGPAFYLYLGTRRGVRMYAEHRFVNFIWGLEAFHRRGSGEAAVHPPLQEKIDRILKQVSDSGDKKWLSFQLKHAAEPSLQDRLLQTFKSLPLPLDEQGLRKFCEACAARRNEVSHFGGDRQGKGGYNAFIRDLDQKSNALSALYHVLLLQEIGLKASLLDFQANRNWRLSAIEHHLREAGLLKPHPPGGQS